MVNHYCTAAEVKAAINYPTTGPVTDANILVNIGYAEDEIENIYKTKFGNIEITGTADGDYSTTTLSDSGESFTANEYIGYVVWIYGGAGSGEYSEITANTTTKLTFSPALSVATDATSTYRILKLGYKSETVDGTGNKTMFLNYQPLINLNSLTVDSTSVTPSTVYQYNASGRLELSTSAEVSYFANNLPQLIDLKYFYGVYPIPQIIKRLCICIAGVRTLTAQIAGTYDDFTSVSLPGGFTGSKGEPYTNIQASLNFLQGEARGIVYGTQSTGQVSGDMRTQPSYRPFALFG